jgi:hypothetical protein
MIKIATCRYAATRRSSRLNGRFLALAEVATAITNSEAVALIGLLAKAKRSAT